MELYKVFISKTGHGFLARNKEFDVAIDADTIEHALSAIKKKVEAVGIQIMQKGCFCPNPCEITELPEDDTVFYIQTEIEKKFKDSASDSIRRNISMPAWMDLQLRQNDIDASKLFQEAAAKKLKEKDYHEKITTIDELKECISESLLLEIKKESIKVAIQANDELWSDKNEKRKNK